MRLLKSLDLTAPAEVKVGQSGIPIVPTGMRGRPYSDAWDIDRAIRDGMQRVTWVYRCVHVRASKSAGLPIVMRKDDPDFGDEVPDHELLPLLNAYPSEDEGAYFFRYRLSAIVDLSRQGAFVEVLRDRAGRITGLRLMPPGMVKPIPGNDGIRMLDGFRVEIPGLTPQTVPVDRMVWVRAPHPADPYSGLTPMEAAGIAIDTEWMAKLYQRNFLRNDGRGSGLLLVSGEMGDVDIAEMQAKLDARSGPGSAGRTQVMEASAVDAQGRPNGQIGGVQYVDTGITPRDAAYIEMRGLTKAEIHAAFGVSDTIGTGSSANRTYENADADYLQFYRDTMVDHCRLLDRPFDRIDGDPTTFTAHDFSSVAVLQRDERANESHLLDQVAAGVMTANEYRDEVGRVPFAEGGDDVLKPLSLYPVASTVPGASVSKTTDIASLPTAIESADVAFGAWSLDAKMLKATRTARARRLGNYEKQTARVLGRFFARQENVTLEKLRAAKTREGTRHWVVETDEKSPRWVGTKTITARDIFNPRKWDAQLGDDLRSMQETIVEDFGSEMHDAALGTVKAKAKDFNVGSRSLLTFFETRGNYVSGMNDTTYDQLTTALAEGEAAGETIAGLADRVQGVFAVASESRAELIARTEVVSAANAGATEGARQTGVVELKTWLAVQDDRTRDSHADEGDGQTVGLDEFFEVDGEELDYPGDPAGSPANVCNCRCSVIFGTADGPLL